MSKLSHWFTHQAIVSCLLHWKMCVHADLYTHAEFRAAPRPSISFISCEPNSWASGSILPVFCLISGFPLPHFLVIWVPCHVFEQMGPPTSLKQMASCMSSVGRVRRACELSTWSESPGLWSSGETEWENGQRKDQIHPACKKSSDKRYNKGDYGWKQAS